MEFLNKILNRKENASTSEIMGAEKALASLQKEINSATPEGKRDIAKILRNVFGPAMVAVLLSFSSEASAQFSGQPQYGGQPTYSMWGGQQGYGTYVPPPLTKGQKTVVTAVKVKQAANILSAVGNVIYQVGVLQEINAATKPPPPPPPPPVQTPHK